MGSKNNDSRIELTSTEQTKKGKVLSQENWIVGRSDPSTAIKSIVREKFTNNPYKGKSDGVVRIMSGESERPNTWRDWIPFIGGTKPEPELIYRGKAIDDNRHDTLPDSEGSDDNIFQLLPKFHAAGDVTVNYNDLVRVRYYDINNNFVGVVGIIEENLGSSTNDSNGPGTAGSRQPKPNQKPPKELKKLPKLNHTPSSKVAVYPHNPITGALVKAVGDIDPLITSRVGGRNVQGAPQASREHSGIDLSAIMGAPIFAALEGQIAVRKQTLSARLKKKKAWDYRNYKVGDLIGFGYYVVIKTTNLKNLEPLYTIYGHLNASAYNIWPKSFGRTIIGAGQQVGVSGNTGTSTGPHLHFQISYGGNHATPGAAASAHQQFIYDPMTELFGQVFEKK